MGHFCSIVAIPANGVSPRMALQSAAGIHVDRSERREIGSRLKLSLPSPFHGSARSHYFLPRTTGRVGPCSLFTNQVRLKDLEERPEGAGPLTGAGRLVGNDTSNATSPFLEYTHGNKTQAAALLGITRTQLHTRLKRFGLTAGSAA
jgi:DNA-binding NtrC family response regulator